MLTSRGQGATLLGASAVIFATAPTQQMLFSRDVQALELDCVAMPSQCNTKEFHARRDATER